MFYDLERLKEVLSNIIRFDGHPYWVKGFVGGAEILPAVDMYINDKGGVLLSAYWNGVPAVDRPHLQLTGAATATFFKKYWAEVWNRGRLLNIHGAQDLTAVRDIAVSLGLKNSDWADFVDGARSPPIEGRRAAAPLNRHAKALSRTRNSTMDWTAGYITDIDYTHGYYRETSPCMIDFALLLRSYEPPSRTQMRYLELGFGQGLSENIHAAAVPGAFFGTDFNPAHAANAKAMARGLAGGRPVFRRQLRRASGQPRPAGFRLHRAPRNLELGDRRDAQRHHRHHPGAI